MNASKITGSPYDASVICPIDREPLYEREEKLICSRGHEFEMDGGILHLFIEEKQDRNAVTRAVKEFYERTPFPNYNEFDNLASFARRAREGVFAKLLSEQMPHGANILEVGCGTAQLSNYLAATCMANVYAADMSVASLELGFDFSKQNDIQGIRFLCMNLFRGPIKNSTMDVVICNGVLHHTADPRAGFLKISQLVKPGGFVFLGLYSPIGRLMLDVRRRCRKVFGDWILKFDAQIRSDLSAEKHRAWVLDQYEHPHEAKFSMSEVLEWFDEAGFSFVSSIPKIGGSFSANEQLFEPRSPGTWLDRLMTEVGMLLRGGSEGGLYIMVGRKGSERTGTCNEVEVKDR